MQVYNSDEMPQSNNQPIVVLSSHTFGQVVKFTYDASCKYDNLFQDDQSLYDDLKRIHDSCMLQPQDHLITMENEDYLRSLMTKIIETSKTPVSTPKVVVVEKAADEIPQVLVAINKRPRKAMETPTIAHRNEMSPSEVLKIMKLGQCAYPGSVHINHWIPIGTNGYHIFITSSLATPVNKERWNLAKTSALLVAATDKNNQDMAIQMEQVKLEKKLQQATRRLEKSKDEAAVLMAEEDPEENVVDEDVLLLL